MSFINLFEKGLFDQTARMPVSSPSFQNLLWVLKQWIWRRTSLFCSIFKAQLPLTCHVVPAARAFIIKLFASASCLIRLTKNIQRSTWEKNIPRSTWANRDICCFFSFTRFANISTELLRSRKQAIVGRDHLLGKCNAMKRASLCFFRDMCKLFSLLIVSETQE